MQKMKYVRYFACLILPVFLLVKVNGQALKDEAEIVKTLTDYMEGRNKGDTARLRSAFFPGADLRHINANGEFAIWKIEDYVNGIKPGRRANCTGDIISINIAGNAAQAKIELYYPDRTYADYFNLLKQNGKWLIASKSFSLYPVRPKVLFIVSSHSKVEGTNQKTGVHLGEVAMAYKIISDAGYDIDIVSTEGGKAHYYGVDVNHQAVEWFVQNTDAMRKLTHSKKPDSITARIYKAVFVAGGHGAMWDLPDNNKVQKLISEIYDNNGVVAAVCHGPAALLKVKVKDGSYLVSGKSVTAFTNNEEKASGEKKLPFLLETELSKTGGKFKGASNWSANVLVDGRLITGQNPASTDKLAEAMVALLSGQ
ncbi:MAG TPA: nuclear transport factor 2 family protein [Chitinophagaceae bacterium]|nr:nuclear transport factor 2 family protein [Chitinophagaceae bacterium]